MICYVILIIIIVEKAVSLNLSEVEMVLSTAECGKSLRLLNINAGQALQSRLAAMGLVPGVEFEVIANHSRGPMVLAVEESRIMLGRGMAEKVVVG
jgi:ferrous iron transport protein A